MFFASKLCGKSFYHKPALCNIQLKPHDRLYITVLEVVSAKPNWRTPQFNLTLGPPSLLTANTRLKTRSKFGENFKTTFTANAPNRSLVNSPQPNEKTETPKLETYAGRKNQGEFNKKNMRSKE